MTIDEIQDALRFDMDMMLFDTNTGETYPKESLKYGNEMNYIHYCANKEAIELLDELKELRKMREDIESNANAIKNKGYNKAIDELLNELNILSEYARPVGWSNKVEIIPMRTVRDVAEQMKEGEIDA